MKRIKDFSFDEIIIYGCDPFEGRTVFYNVLTDQISIGLFSVGGRILTVIDNKHETLELKEFTLLEEIGVL